MGKSVRVKLNSAGIESILLNEPVFKSILNDTASMIEGNLVMKPGQSVYRDAESFADRQRVMIGIDGADRETFLNGIVNSAVEASGGIKKGRGGR